MAKNWAGFVNKDRLAGTALDLLGLHKFAASTFAVNDSSPGRRRDVCSWALSKSPRDVGLESEMRTIADVGF